jgi:hypothetical protein
MSNDGFHFWPRRAIRVEWSGLEPPHLPRTSLPGSSRLYSFRMAMHAYEPRFDGDGLTMNPRLVFEKAPILGNT